MTITPADLRRLGEPESSIAYLAEHPEHVPVVDVRPPNPPRNDEE